MTIFRPTILGLLGLAACANDAEPFRGFSDGEPPPGGAPSTPAPKDPATPAQCAKGGSGRLLQCATGCGPAMFDNVLFDEAFDPAYDTRWTASFAAPVRTNDGLKFGPHPIPADWWNTYSPTTTKRADFGDVLVCVRARVQLGASPGANTLELSLRGMTFAYAVTTHELNLATKIADEQWVQHAHTTPAAPPPAGEREIELALFGAGNAFHGEVKDVASGTVDDIHGTYALPAQGALTLLGWQLVQPLVVTRVVVGAPGADARARIEAP